MDHEASNGYPNVPHFYGDNSLNGWEQVVKEVHLAGGKIFPQLWHVGSIRQTQLNHHVPGYAPSAVAHPYIKNGQIPHEMTFEDIAKVIEAFAKGAIEAKKLGFDGVEIHGAHGYLIDQFFWDRTNKRQDGYGGDNISKRVRFAVELIQAVRSSVGSDFPISFRFSQWKLGDYQAKLASCPEELESFLSPLASAGVDLFHCVNFFLIGFEVDLNVVSQ